MTRRKLAALLVPLAAIAAVAVVVAATATAARQADRDRLGVRLEGRDGAVRQSRARSGERPRRPGQRAGRRQGPAAEDRHVRHAGQQAGNRVGLRREAARPGRRHHLHDVRRRLRRTGRAEGDQRREAHDRAVHRHRSDGPEALRAEGQPRLLVRQRRPGRGVGDGAVRVGQGLEVGRARDGHGASSTSRTSSRRSRRGSPSSAARSSRRRATSRSAARASRT